MPGVAVHRGILRAQATEHHRRFLSNETDHVSQRRLSFYVVRYCTRLLCSLYAYLVGG